MAWKRALQPKERVYLKEVMDSKISQQVTEKVREEPSPSKTWHYYAELFKYWVPGAIKELMAEFPNDPELKKAVERARVGWKYLEEGIAENDENKTFDVAMRIGLLFDKWTKYYPPGTFFDHTVRDPYVIRPCGPYLPWCREGRKYEQPGSWTKLAE